MKHIDEQAISYLIPNLDAQESAQELHELRAEFKEIEQAAKNLASYCEGKAHAMEMRLRGDVAAAMRFEEAAHAMYRRLPDWAKW